MGSLLEYSYTHLVSLLPASQAYKASGVSQASQTFSASLVFRA